MHEYMIAGQQVWCKIGLEPSCGEHDLFGESLLPEGVDWALIEEVQS